MCFDWKNWENEPVIGNISFKGNHTFSGLLTSQRIIWCFGFFYFWNLGLCKLFKFFPILLKKKSHHVTLSLYSAKFWSFVVLNSHLFSSETPCYTILAVFLLSLINYLKSPQISSILVLFTLLCFQSVLHLLVYIFTEPSTCRQKTTSESSFFPTVWVSETWAQAILLKFYYSFIIIFLLLFPTSSLLFAPPPFHKCDYYLCWRASVVECNKLCCLGQED